MEPEPVPAAPRDLPLQGIRAIDLCGAFGAYAGRLLADLGADVTRIVPPGGDPLSGETPMVPTPVGPRSAFGWFVSMDKRVLALDLEDPLDRAHCEGLLASADVVLETWGPDPVGPGGWDRSDLAARFPRLVVVSMTPFGVEGPRSRDAGTDLIALAAGGLLSLGGYPDGPPIATHGQAQLGASIFGAAAAIYGLIARLGDGSGRHMDVAAEEVVAAALEDAIPQFDLIGTVRRRAGATPREAGTGIYRCADGWVSMVAGRLGTAKAWRSLVAWLSEAEVEGANELLGEQWGSFPFRQRPESVARFVDIFERFAAGRGKAQLYEEAQRRDIALAPVNEIPDVMDDDQLLARGFFASVDIPELRRRIRVPGRPYRLSGEGPYEPWLPEAPRGSAATSTAESGPEAAPIAAAVRFAAS